MFWLLSMNCSPSQIYYFSRKKILVHFFRLSVLFFLGGRGIGWYQQKTLTKISISTKSTYRNKSTDCKVSGRTDIFGQTYAKRKNKCRGEACGINICGFATSLHGWGTCFIANLLFCILSHQTVFILPNKSN